MYTNDNNLETLASQFSDKSICSHYQIAMLGHLNFNLFNELKKLSIYEAYMDKVISRGITFEQFYHSTKTLIESTKNLDFDCGFLKPKDFKNFCSLLNIEFKYLCDEYYEFVLIKDYPQIILNNRLSLNITQKELASKCKISPVTMGKLENKSMYPSRTQFLKLKEVIKF